MQVGVKPIRSLVSVSPRRHLRLPGLGFTGQSISFKAGSASAEESQADTNGVRLGTTATLPSAVRMPALKPSASMTLPSLAVVRGEPRPQQSLRLPQSLSLRTQRPSLLIGGSGVSEKDVRFPYGQREVEGFRTPTNTTAGAPPLTTANTNTPPAPRPFSLPSVSAAKQMQLPEVKTLLGPQGARVSILPPRPLDSNEVDLPGAGSPPASTRPVIAKAASLNSTEKTYPPYPTTTARLLSVKLPGSSSATLTPQVNAPQAAPGREHQSPAARPTSSTPHRLALPASSALASLTRPAMSGSSTDSLDASVPALRLPSSSSLMVEGSESGPLGETTSGLTAIGGKLDRLISLLGKENQPKFSMTTVRQLPWYSELGPHHE